MAQNVAQAATPAAAIVGAKAAEVASATHHLANLPDPGAPNIKVVNAVSLKLPEFNPSRVKYWFLMAESEFRIKNITADLNKFSYVVSSIKGDVFDWVMDLVRAPLQAGTYQGLKERLLQAFGRTPMERANAVMDWPGLGDLKPLALYDKMAATLPNGTDWDHILVKACFIRQLPPDVRDHLSDKMEQSTRAIAAAADRFFASYRTRQNPTAGVVNALEYESCEICVVKKIGGFPRRPRNQQDGTYKCWAHARWSNQAYTCKGGECVLAGRPLAIRPAPTAKNMRAAENVQAGQC
jgi:hypothetical protein